MKNESRPPELSFACPKRWESMRAAGSQERFCEQCQLHVRDLSAMTQPAIREYLARGDGKNCVSYQVRADGSMVVRTRWSVLRRPFNALWRGAMALLAMVAPLAFASCADRSVSRLGGAPVMSSGEGKDAPAMMGAAHNSGRIAGKPAAQPPPQ